jgi:hypothetical protein
MAPREQSDAGSRQQGTARVTIVSRHRDTAGVMMLLAATFVIFLIWMGM